MPFDFIEIRDAPGISRSVWLQCVGGAKRCATCLCSKSSNTLKYNLNFRVLRVQIVKITTVRWYDVSSNESVQNSESIWIGRSSKLSKIENWFIAKHTCIHGVTRQHRRWKRTIFETIKYKIFLKSVILERSYIKLVLHKIQLRKIND